MRNLIPSILFAAACSPAYADRVAMYNPSPRIAIAEAPAKVRAPYDVDILRGNGEVLPTYVANGRYYVQGSAGERYTIRVSNPTPRRVEAIVSVDGLDAIDGESGDLRKRGYIVPPYGEVNIEGFRTSLSDVATFRFSSVDGSYAGLKGKARNVGVIAVALFEEREPPREQIAVPVHPHRHRHDDEYLGGAPGADAKTAPAPADRAAGAASKSASEAAPSKRSDDGGYSTAERPTYRPGLGTEFGESRYSGASYTRFERATHRPVAIAELRYNDAAGLVALGIHVHDFPYPDDIGLRETANPFPGDRFAHPPRR